jgi:hypothetical protein
MSGKFTAVQKPLTISLLPSPSEGELAQPGGADSGPRELGDGGIPPAGLRLGAKLGCVSHYRLWRPGPRSRPGAAVKAETFLRAAGAS